MFGLGEDRALQIVTHLQSSDRVTGQRTNVDLQVCITDTSFEILKSLGFRYELDPVRLPKLPLWFR